MISGENFGWLDGWIFYFFSMAIPLSLQRFAISILQKEDSKPVIWGFRFCLGFGMCAIAGDGKEVMKNASIAVTLYTTDSLRTGKSAPGGD